MASTAGARAVPLARVDVPAWLKQCDAAWVGGALVVTLLLCGAPYVVAASFGPTELQRMGTFWFVRDFSQYQAALHDGAQQSGWLIQNRFSTEPHAPALMYTLYVAAGKLAGALRIDQLTMFGALEWVGRFALVASLYGFTASFTPDRNTRRLAVLLAAGTLGFGALLLPLGILAQPAGALNIYLEINSFGLFFAAPHLMLGMALTLTCAILYLQALARRGVWLAALAGTIACLSLVHPFNLPVLVCVLAVHAAWTGRQAWPAVAVSALAAAPMLLYSLVVFQLDPFWSGTYAAQNHMPSPPPWALVLDLGLVLLAAPLAWPIVRHWSADRRRLILIWVGLGLLWMYAPVPYQRRFGFGLQPGLAVVAAVGLLWLQNWLRTHGIGATRRRLVNYGLVLLALCTSVLVYVALLASAARNAPAEVYLWTRHEADAAAWLGEHSSATDVVMASTELANPLVGSIDGRVVHGHIVATFKSDEKQALVRRFFAADASDRERRDILSMTGASIVAIGPRERALGASSLDLPELERIYERDGVAFYRVRP